ncbi:MAG: hypothetical protein ABSB70_21165 [Candidatus Velthaea sp.]
MAITTESLTLGADENIADRAGLKKEPILQREDALSFVNDIRPMFTDMDVDHMKKAMNLAERDSVFQHAEAIYAAVSSGSMPPPSSGEARWTSDMCARFKAWWDHGGPG